MGQTKSLLIMGAVAVSAAASPARAHIDLDAAGSHMSRYGAASIKQGPCGMTGGTRGTNIYTYRPGETITIQLTENIPHPGYFRIAFDQDGDDDFENPSGLDPQFGACNVGASDPNCGPGKADFCNNDSVLVDYLSPHAAGALFTPYTWTVTLPNVECDNCTLQIIQVMEDLGVHGTAYAPDDLYYQCIDLVLAADAPEVDDAPMTNDGMLCPAGTVTPDTDAGVAGSGSAAGTGGAGGEAGAAAGTTGGASGTAGIDGNAGGVGGGIGGAAGISGAGAGAAGGAGGTMGLAPTTGTPGSSDSSGSDSGCSAAGRHEGSALALTIALAPLLRTRRKRAKR